MWSAPSGGASVTISRWRWRGNRVVSVGNACELGTTKLAGEKRMKNPILRDGNEWKDITYDEAIRYSADMLLSAERPLLYGWIGTHGEAQCVGCTWPSSCAASSITPPRSAMGRRSLRIQGGRAPGMARSCREERARPRDLLGLQPESRPSPVISPGIRATRTGSSLENASATGR